MSVIGGASQGGSIDTGDIGHSLRCRDSNNNYLSRVFGAPTDRNKFSVPVAVKRGMLGVTQALFAAGSGDENKTLVRFNSSDQLEFLSVAGNVGQGNLTTSAVFRDPAAWLYLLFVFDFANSTASDRVRIYYRGDLLAVSTSVGVTGANNHYLNAGTVEHRFSRSFSTVQQADQYLARIGWVDGQALTPDSFGYLNTESNAWVTKSQAAVKAVVDAGGTNSFMLDFDDGTSLTTLGYDKSSKGNNWTPNNFSLTPGTTYDWMLDTPSLVNGGNYCVMNPLARSAPAGGSSFAGEGNLTAYQNSTSTWAMILGTLAVSGGKWYWECNVENTLTNTQYLALGVARPETNLNSSNIYVGFSSDSWGYHSTNGNKWNNNSPSAYGASYQTGDVVGVALDIDAGTLTFYKNNASQGVAFSGLSGSFVPAIGSSGGIAKLNFGQRPFAYTPPTGFKALCTANLPEVTGAALNPKNHFDVLLWAGNSTQRNITGTLFPVEALWAKARDRAYSWSQNDIVRGATAKLSSNSTNAEASVAQGVNAFLSNGFSLGNDAGLNESGSTAMAACWKAGGAPVANTAGSITSQVSANVEAGFSIVTYTGTGVNATVGHGLGVAPKLVIVKSRATGSWYVYAQPSGVGNYLNLNQTNGNVASSTAWNNTIPASAVFSLGASATNVSGEGFVAYCFAEIPGYSKIGSYVGNGSTDGPFVNCGFRPRWLLVKRTDSADSWIIYDTARDTYNVMGQRLLAESSTSEATVARFDVTAGGFKIRASDGTCNANGGTYVFMAIAETNFKYANAR